jgi:predicted O-methyltransferase YrrM
VKQLENDSLSRYDTILELINVFKPQSIVETGTWSGHNAIRMLSAARKFHSRPYYIGCDLFEEANAQTDTEEFNVKKHHTEAEVNAFITKSAPFAEVATVKGNTRTTLEHMAADFAFIDGGHSLETIRHDYEALKHCSVIVFDDFYTADEYGRMPDIRKIGCNLIVEKLPHAVIKGSDPVEGGGVVNLAIVFGV